MVIIARILVGLFKKQNTFIDIYLGYGNQIEQLFIWPTSEIWNLEKLNDLAETSTGVTGTRMCLCCQDTQPLFPRPGPWKESNFLITSKLPKHSSNLCRKSLEPIPCPWAFLGVRNLPSHPSSLGRREGKLALGYFLGLLNFPLRPSSECAHMDHWWVAEASSVRSKVDYKILMSGCGSLSFFSLLLLGQYYRLNVWVTLQFIRWSLNQPVIVSVDKHGGN